MKRLFYHLVAALVRATSWVMFSRVEVRRLDRVSWDEPCIVSPNHQNAFLDALLVGIMASVPLTFPSRAAVFGTPFDWFLEALHMVPIYRRRDGFDKLQQTKDILAQQRDQLCQGRSLVMFSETKHAHTYYLRPLSRGSARLTLKTQEATDRPVQLVPVGINYYNLCRPGFKVSIVFGKPLRASEYMERYRENEAVCVNDLRDDLATAMKDCLLVPEKTDEYHNRVDRINRKNEHLPFPEVKQALKTPDDLAPKGEHRPGLETLARGINFLNAGPLWLAAALMRWVDEPPFTASLKFAVGMFGVPLWWIGLFALLAGIGGWIVGAVVVALAVLTMVLHVFLVRLSNPPHPPVD
ncbi:MAG: 1-acyl-sn-glycerol-3-phosphate acyltransferase [Salinibacter sp.]|uniref:1-acyl-sn-glycerol-3-phosphate acyltransferase n=1 Tax=Salinibacter sp. TaxID=2065818 RepID=UPI0035D3E45B